MHPFYETLSPNWASHTPQVPTFANLRRANFVFFSECSGRVLAFALPEMKTKRRNLLLGQQAVFNRLVLIFRPYLREESS